MKKKRSIATLLLLVTIIFSFSSQTMAATPTKSYLVQGSANFNGYSVPVEDYYLTVKDAQKFATLVRNNNSVGWGLLVLGIFINSNFVTGLAALDLIGSNLDSDIRNYTDNNQAVRIQVERDLTWGTKVKVFSWNGSMTNLSHGRYQYKHYSTDVITDIKNY